MYTETSSKKHKVKQAQKKMFNILVVGETRIKNHNVIPQHMY